MTRLGVLAFIFCTAIVIAVIAGATFFLRHRSSESASAQTAEAEFHRLRVRFADQRPLLDMSAREPIAHAGVRQTGARLRLFHTMIFDTRGSQRIVRITVPYWFGYL